MWKTFDEYSQSYRHVRMRRDDAVIELVLHTDSGPAVWGATMHEELGQDNHYKYGMVPGDGVHVVWPELLGTNRGRHFLYMGPTIRMAPSSTSSCHASMAALTFPRGSPSTSRRTNSTVRSMRPRARPRRSPL